MSWFPPGTKVTMLHKVFGLKFISVDISQTLLPLSGFGSAARSSWLHQPARCEVTIRADWQHARAEGRPTGLSLCSQSIINSQLIDRILWKVRCYPTPLNLKNAGVSLMAQLLEMDQLWIWSPFAQPRANVAISGVPGEKGVGTEKKCKKMSWASHTKRPWNPVGSSVTLICWWELCSRWFPRCRTIHFARGSLRCSPRMARATWRWTTFWTCSLSWVRWLHGTWRPTTPLKSTVKSAAFSAAFHRNYLLTLFLRAGLLQGFIDTMQLSNIRITIFSHCSSDTANDYTSVHQKQKQCWIRQQPSGPISEVKGHFVT